MHFTKMHGAGNDYVYVDCFAEPVHRDIPELARRISERRFGVGSDGLVRRGTGVGEKFSLDGALF